MNLRFFEGPAGCGKTTRLVEALAEELAERPLECHQKVLALTKMHGSRRRLSARLAPVCRHRLDCLTVDSFAWRTLHRWGSLARLRFGSSPAESYSEVCCRAGLLLGETCVHRWVTHTYPLIVVDEMQDGKDGQLAIVRGLASSATILAAADEFQDLTGDGDNEAVVWARENGNVEPLQTIHRTQVAGLLQAARAIREGQPVANGPGFVLRGAHNKDVAASFVSRYITYWRTTGDIAIVTPVRPGTSAFVDELLVRVAAKPFTKNGQSFGPHDVPWEMSQEDETSKCARHLALPDEPDGLVLARDLPLSPQGSEAALSRWFDRQRRVTGRTEFSAGEVREQIELINQRARAYRQTHERGLRAMTIHQAKNREFESVIVLWPYQVQGTPERQRRLLYNATTRAKRQALVVVQDPGRLTRPPFAPLT
jgi:UvrD-like helicase C-terminal domain